MKRNVDKDKLISSILEVSGLSEHELFMTRKKESVFARSCIYEYYRKLGYLHKEIAKLTGKGRSTITYHLIEFRYNYKNNPEFKAMYNKLVDLMEESFEKK